MKTNVFSISRVRAFLRTRKPTADDNIERSEPETFVMNFQDYIFGIILTAMWMMIAYAIQTEQITDWIANILTTMSGPYDQRIATLTAVFVLFSDALVIIGISISREASNGDIVDVVNDQSDEINDRFAEFENRIAERIESLERNM